MPSDHLDRGEPVRTLELGFEESKTVAQLFLLTRKPVVYVANVAEEGFGNNPDLGRRRGAGEREGARVVPICAAVEAELAELDDADKAEFLHELGFTRAEVIAYED